MIRVVFLAVVIALLLPIERASAVNPDEMLEDPKLEKRARDLSEGLRCLVCQNQSIDKSNADMARDLRVLVRERLSEGDTDAEVLEYVTDRYGAFVRLKPPVTASTITLWVLPFVVALIAIGASVFYLRSRGGVAQAESSLSPEERAEVADILKNRRDT